MAKYDLIVARYREHPNDMGWLRAVPTDFRIQLCDASSLSIAQEDKEKTIAEFWGAAFPDLVAAGRLFTHVTPNYGGEAGAYLTWIIRHYTTIAPYTVFTQAVPHPHMRMDCTIHQALCNLVQDGSFKDYVPLSALDSATWDSGLSSRAWRMPRRGDYDGKPLRYFMERWLPSAGLMPSWPVANGAIFGVPREAIWWHEKNLYQEILEWLSHAPTSLEVAIMEKVWTPLFMAAAVLKR